jgi:2-methylisocitrate lyase-like PEP mutase family enzyme
VIPNPWDVGSAKYLHHLGFKALATTSAGFAFSRGLPDTGALNRDMVLSHLADMSAATELPVNADFQDGYGSTAEAVTASVAMCVQAGISGLSIEDATGDASRPLYELPEAVERIRAARHAIDALRSGVLLTGRAECYLVHHPEPLKESVRRLQAYAEAGADVLYAPGPASRPDIETIVNALAPKPVNILVSSNSGLRVSDLAEMGVRRISVGSALARAAWTGFIRAAEAIARDGVFSGFDGMVSFAALEKLFAGM